MPTGKYLSEAERAQILALQVNKIKICDIATTICRSRHAVDNFLKNTDGYGKKKKTRGNTKVSSRVVGK